MTATEHIEHDYPEAARILGVSEDWLRINIRNLPHYKKSLSSRGRGKVTFSEQHIAEIRQTFEHRPAEPVTRRGPATRRRPA